MNDNSLGRLTLVGRPAVEETLRDLVRKATSAVLSRVAPENLKALVLAGGYGRAEGGIRIDKDGERPANNLDLLLFTVGLRSAARVRLTARINEELETLRRRSGMGIDFSAVDARRVERDHVRLFWYDVRHGHKLLAGDPEFLPSLTRFTAENIDPREMADLVINRGALLVLNDLILANGAMNPVRREAILTHTAKAIIGYGDAFLFGRGAYHWSYVERRLRMARPSIPAAADFKRLYELAMAYRFTGDSFAGTRLIEEAESGQLRKTLGALHLEIRAATPSGEAQVLRGLRSGLPAVRTRRR